MQLRDPMKGMTEVVDVVASAGGELVGRTRLQKTEVLLELSGLGHGFSFVYKHYGPFSQELVEAAETAQLFGTLTEEKRTTQWGGNYSIFKTTHQPSADQHPSRKLVIELAKAADPIELELAATAAFLASHGYQEPWEETAKRKPEKVTDGRLDKAKVLYQKFRAIETPSPWPEA